MLKIKNSCIRLICLLSGVILAVTLVTPSSAACQNDTNEQVILGGDLFGINIQTDGVPIIKLDKVDTANGYCAPAYDAGIRLSDVIIGINGQSATSAKQITSQINNSCGKSISLTVTRKGEKKDFNLTPVKGKDGNYHIGIWIRDSLSGIGTITYIIPKTLEFAGLGHGICDGDTGSPIPLKRGVVRSVELQTVIKGEKGLPGELKGIFKGNKKGALTENTDHGVYGLLCSLPSDPQTRIPLGSARDIKEGKCMIRCNVDGKAQNYHAIISKIKHRSDTTKNFQIQITDKALLSKTGGIVQGMSGSPIIQNGKLVGAVTHVTVNDPTKGYGIFIENMLNATNIPMAKAS